MDLTVEPSRVPGDDVEALRARLLDWYDRHRRDLPWRARAGEAVDPYRVLVSEVMLQQTTAATAAARFAAFVERFPTLADLAAAPLDDVLHAWQGLGYYRRAHALHACARAVLAEHGGALPGRAEALRRLPGIGPYTAAAVAAIAFGEAAVAIDGNVERVLARLFGLEEPLPRGRRRLEAAAAGLACPERADAFAQAMIELGALVCTPRRPRCLACPWRTTCVGAASGQPERYPRRAEKPARRVRRGVAFLLTRADGAVRMRRRAEQGLLAGMIELPSTPWDLADGATDPYRHAPAETEWRMLDGEVRHAFSHLELVLEVAAGQGEAADEGFWVRPDDFAALALPTLTRKILAHAGYRVPRPTGRSAAASGRQASRT